MEKSGVLAIGFAIVIAFASLGYGWYANSTTNSSLNSQSEGLQSSIDSLQATISPLQNTIASLQGSITSLQGTVTNLQGELTQNEQAESSSAQQISSIQSSITGLQDSLQVLQVKVTSVSLNLNSTQSADVVELQQISSELQGISATIQTLSAKVAALAPQVPLSTLVVVGDTYDNVSHTFQFTVQNTQNFTVYAQLSATFWGTGCEYYNNQGSYLSQIYTFRPLSDTVTSLSMNLGSYQGSGFCGTTPVVDLTMSYIAATSTSVSQTYTFNVIPFYTWSQPTG
jgi:prefoldin subunit 5